MRYVAVLVGFVFIAVIFYNAGYYRGYKRAESETNKLHIWAAEVSK